MLKASEAHFIKPLKSRTAAKYSFLQLSVFKMQLYGFNFSVHLQRLMGPEVGQDPFLLLYLA